MREWSKGALTLLITVALVGCEHDLTEVPVSGTDMVTSVTDRMPTSKMTVDQILSQLGASDGEVIVGVKEIGATRGVSRDGKQEVPYSQAKQAQAAILEEYDGLELLHGVDLLPGGVSRGLGLLADPGRSGEHPYAPFFLARIEDVDAPATRRLVERMLRNPRVDYVEPNWAPGGTVLSLPTSTLEADLELSSLDHIPWGVDTVRAPGAWSMGYTGAAVLQDDGFVMIDTGFDWDPTRTGSVGNGPDSPIHPDLARGGGFQNVPDFLGRDTCDPNMDTCYYEGPAHGSGVLGLAIGRENNTHVKGVAHGNGTGIAYVYKIFQREETQIDDVYVFAKAVELVDAMLDPPRVGVTSVGWEGGCPGTCTSLRNAFASSSNKTLWFAAAGNNQMADPALFPEVVAVGAIGRGHPTFGLHHLGPAHPAIEFTAPGESLRTTWNRAKSFDGTRVDSGTSFAAPIAAGVAVLVLEKFPSLTPSQLRQRMQDYARDVGDPGRDDFFGYGIPDAVCILNGMAACPGEGPIGLDSGEGGGGGGECDPEDPECCEEPDVVDPTEEPDSCGDLETLNSGTAVPADTVLISPS